MPDIYDAGDVIDLRAAFQSGGVFADPASVQLDITDPAGTITTFTYGGGSITKDAVGQYRRTYQVDAAAVAGIWRYKWTTTGTPRVTENGYFVVRAEPLGELVRMVREELEDWPNKAVLTDNPLTNGATSITLSSANDAALFPQSGMYVEFDDGTDEIVYTTAPADQAANTVAVRRGQDGTPARSHVANTGLIVGPSFRRRKVLQALSTIVDFELWPHVAVFSEFPLTGYNPASDFFAAPVPDIVEISYAYQLISGVKHRVHVEWLPPELADDTNAPLGAVMIRAAVDSSTIFVAYKARPTLGNLTGKLRGLAVLGAVAHITQLKEAKDAAGKGAYLQGQQPGSSLRAGLVLWQRFTEARAHEMVSLAKLEQQRKRDFVRGV